MHRFRSHVIAPTLAYLAERGVDTDAVVRASRLPFDAVRAPYVELPLAQLHAFFEHAAVHDEALGVHVGTRLSRSTWDVIQVSALSAPTLGAGLLRVAKLIPLFNDFVRIDVREGDGGMRIEHSIDGEPVGLSRHGNELWLVAMLERAREATGADLRPRACWLAHPRPADASALEQVARADRIEYGAGATGIAFSSEDAALPLRSADPVLLAVLDRLASQTLAVVSDRRGIAAQVCRHLARSLDDGVPPVGRVARALGLSARSLQRALRDEGTSYRALVDQVRRTRARELLAAGTPIDEVAFRLAYSQPSAFTRAFARWTGKQPG